MTGYLAVPLDGNDVADAHGRVTVVGGVFIVEAVFKIVQHAAFQVAGFQRRGVNQVIIVPLHRLPDGLDPLQSLIADVPQLVGVLHLINSEAVALVIEERLLPFLLVVHALFDLGIESRAFLPFLAGDGEDPVVGVQVGGIKSHRRILTLLDDINGQVALHQLIGAFFGKGQKVPVHVAALFQIVLGQRGVRHGVFVQMLLRGVRQLGGFRGGGLGRCLHLLDSRLLQGRNHGQRRILDGLAAHVVHLADFQRGGGQGQLRRVQLAAVQLLHGRHIVERVVPAGVAELNMKIGGIVQHQKGLAVLGAGFRRGGCFLCGRLRHRLFRLGSQVNAALLADNLIMPVNVRDQFPGRLVDGLQTGTQLRQLLTLAPVGDVAEAVLAGLDTVILANRVGNALGLHLLGVAVFLLGRLLVTGPGRFLLDLGVVMQLAVGDLMDGGGNGLHLAHACPDGDALLVRREIPVHVGGHRLHGERHRRGPAQGLHESLVVLDIPGQGGRQLRQRFPICLAHIEHLHRAEHRDLNFPFLHDDLAILIQHGGFGVRVQLLFLDLFLERRGRDDGDTVFTALHMALKLIFPLVVPGHQRGVRLLHIDEHGVVDRVAVEPGHHGQVAHILFALEQLFNALLDACRDLLQPFPVGGFVSHDFHSPFYGRKFSGVFCDPLVLFLGTAVEKSVQQIAHVLFFLNSLQKARVRVLVRRPGGIVGLPFSEQVVVIRQNAPGVFPIFFPCLRLGFLPDMVSPDRGLAVVSQAKILGQLLGGLLGGQVIETGGEVDHVAVCAAAKTVETGVHLHAGVAVIVEGATGHAAAPHRDAVKLRRFPDGDGLFYDFKDALAHAYLPPAFGTGGLYPAALARSLAAFRRSALYGSRTDTQRLGTVKV